MSSVEVSGLEGLEDASPTGISASRLADEIPSPSNSPIATDVQSTFPSAPSSLHQISAPTTNNPSRSLNPASANVESRGVKRQRSGGDFAAIEGQESELSTGATVHPSKRQRGGDTGSDNRNMRLEDNAASPNSHSGPVSNGTGKPSGSSQANGSSTNGNSNGHSDRAVSRPTGSFFGHDREEVTRILIQSLTDLGYHGAAGTLSQESGYELENTSVAAFRNAIQQGEWAEAESLLFGRRSNCGGGVGLKGNGHANSSGALSRGAGPLFNGQFPGLPLAEGANQKEMLFLIRQQKYLELLEMRDLGTALIVLRQEITPLHQDTPRLHTLSRQVNLMMCPTAEELRHQARWDGAEGESRDQLLSQLSTSIAPSVMIPEHRLAVLLKQVQDNQINNCLYHNTTSIPSLYHDHVCDKDDFPLEVLTELRDHHDEVWYIAFSPSGNMLATASADNNIFVYNTTSWRLMLRLNETHTNSEVAGVVVIAWSPDDRYLLSCSRANQLTVYDINDSGRRVSTFTNYTYPVTAAAWLPDGEHFVVGSQDVERSLVQYRLGDGSPVHEFATRQQKLRIHDLAISADGSRMAAITNDHRILTYNLKSQQKSLVAEIAMEEELTSISLSSDGSNLLAGMKNSTLFMLDTETGDFLQRYQGAKSQEFVIRSRFGGAGEGFVISGSEDSCVYIWRRQSGVQVACLESHMPGSVNAVAWHPTNFAMFASAGDDKRVKIWASQPLIRSLSSSSTRHNRQSSISGTRNLLQPNSSDDNDMRR
ncbi:hypothetical protein B9Z65_1892 [Elsinoe australis]|uniref:CTLH domain-containing protein n=1 Tax=Elsinoe australis TaxID=40998 RepID=A0A2P7YL72_9PEZI|nr:hypothetical protein B9Z65_1892 [Elsinoe australis]